MITLSTSKLFTPQFRSYFADKPITHLWVRVGEANERVEIPFSSWETFPVSDEYPALPSSFGVVTSEPIDGNEWTRYVFPKLAPVTEIEVDEMPAVMVSGGTDVNITLINLTPHALNVFGVSGFYTIPASGLVARVSTETHDAGYLGEFPLYRTSFGKVTDLPAFREDVYYIVSGLVKSAVPDRLDLLCPAELIRDDEGRVVGTWGLSI